MPSIMETNDYDMRMHRAQGPASVLLISKLPLDAINIGWLHRKTDRNNDDDARMSLDAIYPSSSSFLIKISEDKIAIPRTTLLLGSGVLQQQQQKLLREITPTAV